MGAKNKRPLPRTPAWRSLMTPAGTIGCLAQRSHFRTPIKAQRSHFRTPIKEEPVQDTHQRCQFRKSRQFWTPINLNEQISGHPPTQSAALLRIYANAQLTWLAIQEMI